MVGSPESPPVAANDLVTKFDKLTGTTTYSMVEGGVIQEHKEKLLHFLHDGKELLTELEDYINKNTTRLAGGGGGHWHFTYEGGPETPVKVCPF